MSRYLPGSHTVAVANGTLAIQLALHAVGEPRGTVVTTPFTFAATTTALAWEGYDVRFADIDPDTFNLDPDSVRERIDATTVGIMGVHVFGNPAGAAELARLAHEDQRWAIFDAAHAVGVRIVGSSLFDLGSASTLSFHATKPFHTFEGGMVTSSERGLAERVRTLRNFGLDASGDILVPGINAKLSEAHAAMGVANLHRLDRWIESRRRRYELYRDLLSTCDRIGFQRVEAKRYNFSYFPILLPDRHHRDLVQRALVRQRVHPRSYFYPLTSRFSFLGSSRSDPCPRAVDVAERVLVLPLYPDLPLATVRWICGSIVKAVR